MTRLALGWDSGLPDEAARMESASGCDTRVPGPEGRRTVVLDLCLGRWAGGRS